MAYKIIGGGGGLCIASRRDAGGLQGWEIFLRASRRIPGGTQLLAKRSAMYLPERWPSYFAKAKGLEVTDPDGRTPVDMSMMGMGACVPGYADPEGAVASILKRALMKRGFYRLA
jgi:glutamate-1-semialdehyde aminotransferase